MIKSYISEKYNREHPALPHIFPDDLIVGVLNIGYTFKISIKTKKYINFFENSSNKGIDYKNLLNILDNESKGNNLMHENLILNGYIADMTKDDSHALEHFLRMASFGNVGNSRLGTRGKITIEEAIVFAFTEFEPPPPEIQSHPSFGMLKDNPIYQNLKTIITQTPIFRKLSSLSSTKYLSSLGSGGESSNDSCVNR
jgi:hypothetical protein